MTIPPETHAQENALLTVLSMDQALGTEVGAALLRMVREIPTDDRNDSCAVAERIAPGAT